MEDRKIFVKDQYLNTAQDVNSYPYIRTCVYRLGYSLIETCTNKLQQQQHDVVTSVVFSVVRCMQDLQQEYPCNEFRNSLLGYAPEYIIKEAIPFIPHS